MIPKVLSDSMGFLCKHPGFFIPRLIDSTNWSFILYFWLRQIFNLTTNHQIQHLYSILLVLPIAFLFWQITIIINSMYPVLVKQFRVNGLLKMKQAFQEALYKYPHAFVGNALPIVIMALCSLPFGGLAIWGYLGGIKILLYVGSILVAVVAIIGSIIFFFSPTAVILEKGNPLNAIKHGIKLCKSNLKEVTFFTIFSFLVLSLAIRFGGTLQEYGIVGFFLSRYLGAIILTYTSVINPNIYIELK